MRRFLSLVALVILSGCATVTTIAPKEGQLTADGRTVLSTVAVENTDWLFLCLLPVASGDPEEPNRTTCRWFRDTVTLENQMKMIENEAKRIGATQAVDVVSYENDESIVWILFLRRKLHTSAMLVK